MDFANDPLVADFDSLANGEPSRGSGGPQFAPGKYKVKLVSCKSVPKKDAPTKTTPTTELRVFDVVDSANPNALSDYAGKVYKAFNSFSTGNADLDKNNRMAIAKLIAACGKGEAWKAYVALVNSPAGKAGGMVLNESTICNWIDNTCRDSQLILELTEQYMSEKKLAANAALVAEGKQPKVYLDHSFHAIEAVAPAAAPAAHATTGASAPFGMN